MTLGNLLWIVGIGAVFFLMMRKGGGCCGGGSGHDDNHGSQKKELGHNQGDDKEQPRGGCCG